MNQDILSVNSCVCFMLEGYVLEKIIMYPPKNHDIKCSRNEITN